MKTFLSFLAFVTVSFNAFGLIAQPTSRYPDIYQKPWTNNYNYWGQPWGLQRPLYFYPSLPFQGFMFPPHYPTYFRPQGPSPYSPYYQCPTCGGTPYLPPVFPSSGF